MSGGTITITRPMTLSGNYKDPDYLNLVSNDTITGGTIQIGDTTVSFTAPANTNFSILSEPPIWNLELHNTYSLDLLFAGANTIISNYFRIRRMASASLNGQSILIGGDFINDSILHLGSSGSRRITFNGNPNAIPATSQNQNIKIKKAYGTGLNDFLFDLVINKPGGGSVNLVSDAVYVNSNIILTNSLQFTSTNTSIINTNTNYFQLGTSTSDAATVQRNGLGHVNGEFRQWFNNGNYTYFIPIGASTVAAFTPATIVTSTASATAGLVSFTAYGIKHPDLANLSNIDTSTSIDRYWNINPKAVSPYPAFALGTNGYYNLTLQFVKGAIPTGDIKSSAILGAFEQFRRTPSWNTAGTWYSTTPDIRTDSSTKGINFTTWGDFVVGDPAGFKFYSIANGEWSTPSTWSLTGYSGVASTIYAPSGIGDRVYIGNGKTVTLSNSTPNIRSVVIETYNLNPGTLLFQNDKYLRSETFILNDSCTLGTTDAYGFNSLTSLNNFAGGVRSTITRTYGQGRFIYNGTTSQATGDGLVTAKSIIVNTSGSNNSVGLGSNHVIIYDSLAVNTSKFGFNNDTFELKGQLVVKTPAKITGTDGALIVSSNNNQYFVLNNTGGDTINNLQLSKPAGKVIISGSDTTGNLYIRDTLLFNTGNVGIIDSRTNTRRVILISNSTKILRSGLGHIDGILDRPFSTSSESFKYEVGKGFTYLPITLSLSAGTGNAGIVRGWVDTLNFLVSRLDNVKRINYFWNLTNASTFTLGTRLANTTIQFPSSLLSNLYGGAVNNNTVLKRLSIPAETKLWSLRTTYPSQLTWNSGIASVSITNSTDYWTGLGQFYVGDKGSVNFYSRQSGNWNDYNCWTLDPSHIGSSTGGDYPNQDADCLQDVIYIGLNHTITLNVPNVYIDTLVVRHGSIFDIGTGIINCGLCGSPTPTLGLISLRDTATIRLGGANIPRTDTNFINFKIYDINSNTYIDFYGNQVIPNNPFSNTLYLNNVIFSQSGTKLIGNTPVIINGNCYIKNGATLFLTGGIKYLTVKKNIYNNSILNNSGFIQIGQ